MGLSEVVSHCESEYLPVCVPSISADFRKSWDLTRSFTSDRENFFLCLVLLHEVRTARISFFMNKNHYESYTAASAAIMIIHSKEEEQ